MKFALILGRISLAAVWFVEGFVAKVLGTRTDELAILADTGFLGDGRVAMIAIGIAETLIGVWVLTPWFKRTAAFVQTALIVGFNAGGLIFAGEHIPAPLDLLSKNLAIIALAWCVALLVPEPKARRAR